MHKTLSALYLIAMATVLTGCYYMPNEDDFSVIPLTNNRDFNRDQGGDSSQLIPHANY